MNQSKLKYARERLNVMVNAVVAKVKSKYPIKPELDDAEAIDMIIADPSIFNWGAVKEATEDGSYAVKSVFGEQLENVVKRDNEYIRIANTKVRETIDAEISLIKANKTAVEDELVLGDEAKALELLASFNAQYSEKE